MSIRVGLLALLFSGCAFYQYAHIPDTPQPSWIGHTEHELVVAYGPPTRTDSDGSDGRILSYTKTSAQTIENHTKFDDSSRTTTTTTGTAFYVNAEGVIYAVKGIER